MHDTYTLVNPNGTDIQDKECVIVQLETMNTPL
jgi:hypothetical protein